LSEKNDRRTNSSVKTKIYDCSNPERVAYLILWKRLKSVADAGFARRNTGARITRGNSGNGVLLTRENRAGQEQKSRNGKGVRPRDERLSPWCFGTQGHSISQFYGLLTTTCGAGLLHFNLGAHFLDLGRLLVETLSELRNCRLEVLLLLRDR